MVALAVMHHYLQSDDKKIKTWRFLCLLPLITAVLHFLIYVRSFDLMLSYGINVAKKDKKDKKKKSTKKPVTQNADMLV